MAQLAIKGHATRGKEVIDTLKMLEGHDVGYIGSGVKYYYYIDEYNNILGVTELSNSQPFITYILEEFLEKYPYKVGDKVIAFGNKCTIIDAIWDKSINEVVYTIKLDVGGYTTTKLSNQLKTYTEETMEEEGILTIDFTKDTRIADKVEVILGDYEFVLEDGKTYFVKKKPKYPKTYEDCRAIINAPEEKIRFGYKSRLLSKFQQLLICRDAYWEIACWKPSKDNLYEDLYCIGFNGAVITFKIKGGHALLSFPTEEIRDAFYENFKELIEECKELL